MRGVVIKCVVKNNEKCELVRKIKMKEKCSADQFMRREIDGGRTKLEVL